MDLHQRISQQRVYHIVESYSLTGTEPSAFESYLNDLLSQYPHGLIEIALVKTLIKNWLTIPMEKGVPFLAAAHHLLKQWQTQTRFSEGKALPSQPPAISFSPGQFFQITGLDPHTAFEALQAITRAPSQAAAESSSGYQKAN